ncbi:hypothetical protein Xoosp14_12 [Xanthomonas phage Xoo-sp14]|nr:hypothetical protein Xoosp14_12 [Xanthomonas phage Xoo-sp14]
MSKNTPIRDVATATNLLRAAVLANINGDLLSKLIKDLSENDSVTVSGATIDRETFDAAMAEINASLMLNEANLVDPEHYAGEQIKEGMGWAGKTLVAGVVIGGLAGLAYWWYNNREGGDGTLFGRTGF